MKLLFSLLFSLSFFLHAQCITGTITDEDDGSSLIGVSVLLQNNTQGTVTDIDGKFNLCVSSPDSVLLMITYTGYETLELLVAPGQKIGLVKLTSAAQLLEEVVVTARGIRKEKAVLGYSASAVRVGGGSRRSRRSRPAANEPEPAQQESYNKITRNGFTKTKKQNFSNLIF